MDAAPGDVVLISAPAGHGKTVLLADLTADAPDRVAWVSLDRMDRDDRTFWIGVLEALHACPAVPADSPLRTLEVPPAPSGEPAFMAALTEGLAALPEPVLLVLDDLHQVSGAEPMSGLDALIRYQRGGLRLVLSSRSDPNLPLGRLRMDGRLVEVRADALAFTPDETRTLLELLGLSLTAEQMAKVHAQTGGWVAGVRLAAMSLREVDDVDEFLTDMAGNDRAIADYLVTEVLSRIPPAVRDLLRRLCVCEEISADLAAALTGNPEAGAMLAMLERESSLVVSHGPGRQWFRIHPLLQAYLKADLRRRDPAYKRSLYAIAARWHVEAGYPLAALRYAQRADGDVLAEVLSRCGLALLTSGQHATLRALTSQCPDDALDRDPRLALTLALAQLDTGEIVAAESLTRRALRSWPDQPDPELVHLRSLAELRTMWLIGGTLSAALVPTQPWDSVGDDGRVLQDLTQAAVAAVSGNAEDTVRHAEAAERMASRMGNRYLAARAESLLATAASIRGDLGALRRHAQIADTLAPAELWDGTTDQVLMSNFRAYCAVMQGEPEEALALAGPARAFAVAPPPGVEPAAVATLIEMVCATAEVDLGQPLLGLHRLREIREKTDVRQTYVKSIAVGALWEHEAALQFGHPEQAHQCRAWLRTAVGTGGDLALASAAAAAERGRFSAAQAQLDELLSSRRPPLVRWVIVSAWVLGASIALRAGRTAEARRAVGHALREAAIIEAYRPLINAPAGVVDLMSADRQLLEGEHDALIERVLGARAHLAPPTTKLTAREQEILRLLPTLRSLDEIAADLWVSVNTVKTHVKAIYTKLGVRSRREAIEVARRRGLLPSHSG
ncbi:MAG TPA: LuxR C-terminal-related transcriptional regulator [Microlunatus sp.]|nr:LuxR C-terminal-related transcriptional regulator [Microlunatus sp.]